MSTLPERVVLPLGRVIDARWSPAEDQRVFTIAAPQANIGLSEEEFALWTAAAGGCSRDELIRTSPLDGPATAYDVLTRYGLLIEIGTDPDTLLREAAGFRILAHSPMGIDPARSVPVIGDPSRQFRTLTPVVHEVYSWSGGTHSLAAAVRLVAARASEAGVNDLEAILPERLVRRVLAELLPAVHAGFASFGFVEVAA